MSTLIHERVELAKQGMSPAVIGRVGRSWEIHNLSLATVCCCRIRSFPRSTIYQPMTGAQFLLDMTGIGDALLVNTDAYRINYEILGNSEPALHAHIFPRRMTDPDRYRGGPVFNYPKAERESRPFDPARDDRLLRSLREFLETSGYALSLDDLR
jgi:hypothetical protein